jgi:aspartate kinase
LIVMKFGGASLRDSERIRHACEIVRAHRRRRPVVVLSALGGVTDELIRSAQSASRGERQLVTRGMSSLATRHRHIAHRLFRDRSRRETTLSEIERLVAEVQDLYRGISLLGELSQRSLDLVCSIGERLSARLFAAALADQDVPAAYIDARAFMITDEDHGRAQVDFPATNRGVRRLLLPIVRRGEVPVVTGFIGSSVTGATTTLGRGGSDYSASIVGAALEADEIWVWKEVDGVCTADPTLFPDAQVVPHISYKEAAELSHFGAEVLHPRTMLPAMRRGIPIRVRNTLRPRSPGTVITARGSRKPNPLIVSSIDDLALVTVEGAGLIGSPALVARVLSEVARIDVNIYMVSMASSEYNVTFAIPSAETAHTVRHLTKALHIEREGEEEVEKILVESGVAIIAAVGSRMKGQVGIAAKVFSALGDAGVNILAIAQGSSEYNITMVVDRRDLKRGIHAVHSRIVADVRPAAVSPKRAARQSSGASKAARPGRLPSISRKSAGLVRQASKMRRSKVRADDGRPVTSVRKAAGNGAGRIREST